MAIWRWKWGWPTGNGCRERFMYRIGSNAVRWHWLWGRPRHSAGGSEDVQDSVGDVPGSEGVPRVNRKLQARWESLSAAGSHCFSGHYSELCGRQDVGVLEIGIIVSTPHIVHETLIVSLFKLMNGRIVLCSD